MSIGSRIKEQREFMGISQTDLARMCNISKQTLYKYENDIITNIPNNKVEIIAEKLNVSAAYLMGWVVYNEEKAHFDVLLSELSDRQKEYVLKLEQLPQEKQEAVFNMIDVLGGK